MISIIILNAFPDKKIKSLGNKELIKISNTTYLIDYKIELFNKIYKNPEIIIIGGFDSKKLSKYLASSKFSDKKYNIKYIEHEPKEIWNTGKSLLEATKKSTGDRMLIMNSSIVLDISIANTIRDCSTSFVLYQSGKNENVGCTIDNANNILRCFYGFDNLIYDVVFLNKSGIDALNNCIKKNDISKMYLFEIINLCVSGGAKITLQKVHKKSLFVVDSIDSVYKLENKYKNCVS